MRLLLLLGIFILTSCVTQRACSRKFPPQLVEVDKTWESYECDSFPVYIPYQEVTFDTSGVIPVNVEFHHTQRRGHLSETIDISKGKITQECHEDAYIDTIQGMRKTIHELSLKKEIQTAYIDHWWIRWVVGGLIFFLIEHIVGLIMWIIKLRAKV